ncbi:hypothetical protein Tco_0565005 [Tanacetum coccineum]
MAAVEVAQTLEYKCGQLKCRSCTRAGKGSLKDIGLKMMEKAQELQKFLVVPVLLDDQMNSVINCLTAKSTWDDLILYHEGPSDVKESRVMDLKLCYNTFKSPSKAFQDSPDDEEDTRSSHEYLNDLEEEYQARALLAKSKRFFKKELRPTKDFEAKYNKVKAKLTLLSSSASASKASTVKNKGVDQLTKDPSSSGQKDLVFVKSSADDTKVSIPGVERLWLSRAEGFILPNHDTGRILPAESQRNITDPSVAVRETLPISKLDCVLSQDWIAFCLKIGLNFVSRLDCVLSQDFLRFVLRLPAFCLLVKTFTAFCIRLYWLEVKRIGVIHLDIQLMKDCLDWDTFWGQNLSEGNEDKDRYNADIRATNILLQGLPKDIYSLINHYTDAKDIWDNVKMLLEGSELTKEDRESQLYDDFEHFRQHKGETIHDYYVWFAKLINDMRNIKMTMSRMQLNSKFVNNMLPEWGRFVTAVKLNRGLRDSNYDQLYAYLKQHEAHANENKMMLDRFTQHTVDPLALMSNVAPQQYNSQSSTNPSSTYVPPHVADNS